MPRMTPSEYQAFQMKTARQHNAPHVGEVEVSESLKRVEPEARLHRQILDYCDAQWPRWKPIHSRMDRPTTTEKGVCDFIIAMPNGRTLYVECKRVGSKLTLEQAAWIYEMKLLNHTVHVVETMGEFLKLI